MMKRMIKNRQALLGLAAASLALGCPAPAGAEDDDEGRELPTTDEILAFCREHVPEAIPLFELVRANEPPEDYREVLEEAGERMLTYREIAEDDGEVAAGLYLREVRTELQLDEIIYEWHVAREGGGETGPIEDKLRAKLVEQVRLELEVGRTELAALKQEVADFEVELSEMESNQGAEVDERLAEILNDEGEDEDDDDEEDENEDGDEDDEGGEED